jgi:hypothetical protein
MYFIVLGVGTNDAATHDVLEQFVAGLLERRGLRGARISSRSCVSIGFGHESGLMVNVREI